MRIAEYSGREPLQIVELEQPRCVNRFGTAPCTATGTPKCYQTWTTCKDRANFNSTGGSIKWRFVRHRKDISAWGDYSDADNPATDGLFGLESVSASSSQINIAGILKGQSPLGKRATVTVSLSDFLFDDYIGDFYLDERTVGEAGFWEKWTARNRFYAGMYLRIYDGYNGQKLEDMRQRLYVLNKVDGPIDGKVTLHGIDPLRLTERDKSQFPRAVDVTLVGDIDAVSTSITVSAPAVADLTDKFGNTTVDYIRIEDEVIGYTGTTDLGDDQYSLTGVVRGALDTVADAHDDEEDVQRVGRYEDLHVWKIAHDLAINHTPILSQFIDLDAWNNEADGYLGSFRLTGTVAEPTGVEDLLGELCQQGQFSIWWDEYAQLINLLIVQPPLGEVEKINDTSHVLTDGAEYTRMPEDRVTRVALRYQPRSVIEKLDEPLNYKVAEVRIDADAENENASDSIIQRSIFSRWLGTRSQALSVTKRIVDNYGNVPERLSIQVDAKDAERSIGTVLDVETSAFKDTEGNVETRRWQIIGNQEVKQGHKYMLTMQRFPYVGKFGIYGANDVPNFADATEAEREALTFYGDENGLLPDGSEGAKYR